MQKKGLYSSLLLSAIILAACNTNSEEVLETSASPEQPTENVQLEAPVEQAPPVEQPPQMEPNPAPVEVPVQEPVQEEPQVAVSIPTTSFITSTSATLNYTINHLKEYTLTEEEPGKDMLFYNENDALSMRIEVFNHADASFDALNEATQQSMAAIAPNNTYESFDLAPYLTAAKRTDFKASAGYLVQYESDKVTAIVYEIEDKFVVLTIFDDYITGITDAFITAGFTIR
ncbi:MAG: hypothetical protein ABS949_00425 [Solibacillus sp.]